MAFRYLFLCGKLPQGGELEALADKLGVSQAKTWETIGGKTTLDEPELQRRVMEAIRLRRDSWVWVLAFISALAALASALAAWVAIGKVATGG